jgi:nucleotide-binding universal stress UspA family protein
MMTSSIAGKRPAARQTPRRAKQDVAPRKSLQIRNVLIPIDFSRPSLDIIEFALPLVQFFGAQLHLVHVVPPGYPLPSLAGLPPVVPELEIGRSVRSRLEDAVKKYSLPLHRENIHALKGRPFEQICELAREANIDLIVTSTRGETGLKHVFLGSTAERIVRYSPCPVLVARPLVRRRSNGKRPQHPLGFRKILVPIDFSRCSAEGLAFALSLARKLRSSLLLMHSVYLQYYVASDEYARYDFPQLLDRVAKVAREQMDDLVKRTDWDGVDVETLLEVGHAGQEICARAQDLGVDLIVTSTHGKTGFKHVLVGSTAEYVVQHAPCSVLVVPTRGRPALTSIPTKI